MTKITASESEPFRPIHPGEILNDEFQYRHISQRSLVKKLGISYSVFNEILNSKRPVTTDIALFIEAALEIPAYMLVNMQSDYNLQVAKEDKSVMQRLKEIRKISAML